MGVARQGNAHLVPLAERQRHLRMLRAALAGVVVLDAALLPGDLRLPFFAVLAVAVGYLAVNLGAETFVRGAAAQRRLFGALLLLDGGFLAAATYLTGGADHPVRYLVLVHLAAVTLLTSYRTGVTIAVWHSLLQVVVFFAAGADTAAQEHRLVALLVALWALTLTVSTFAALNEGELRRRRMQVERLAEMGRALEDAETTLAVGEVLIDALTATFGLGRTVLFEIVDGRPQLLTCRNLSDAMVADFRADRESLLSAAQRDRTARAARRIDPRADPWLAAVLPAARDVAVLPLVANTVVVGVLVTELPDRAAGTDPRLLTMVERFTDHAALAMRNANLLARMHRMAVTDGLTQLANRRSFDRALDRELTRAARDDGRLSVVLLDIDHFKALNDTHGHLVGDTVLREVAAALRECGREYDTVARYGGEEFAAVLPGCSSTVAMQVAERLRRAVRDASTSVPVTASAGVATFPYDGSDVESLLRAADRALYVAKRSGRNLVRAATQVDQGGSVAAS